jgi:hypothetical protein
LITAYSYASEGKEHYILAPAWSAEGHVVARTIDDVLAGVRDWPGNVYELRVDPRDVLGSGQYILKVRRYEVAGVVPRERIFGRNVATLDAFIAELRTFDWLRPSSDDRGRGAAALVAEHYAALGHHGRVRAGPVRLVRDTHQIEPVIQGGGKVADRAGLKARVKALETAVRAVDRRLSMPMKLALMRIVASVVVPAAWRASWKLATAAHVDVALASFREAAASVVLDDVSARLIEHTARALEVGVEQGWELLITLPTGARDTPHERAAIATLAAAAQAEFPDDYGEARPQFDHAIARGVEGVWRWARSFTDHACRAASRHAYHLASGLGHPDPWTPWVGLFRLGLWPVLEDGVEMTVYDPPVTRE